VVTDAAGDEMQLGRGERVGGLEERSRWPPTRFGVFLLLLLLPFLAALWRAS